MSRRINVAKDPFRGGSMWVGTLYWVVRADYADAIINPPIGKSLSGYEHLAVCDTLFGPFGNETDWRRFHKPGSAEGEDRYTDSAKHPYDVHWFKRRYEVECSGRKDRVAVNRVWHNALMTHADGVRIGRDRVAYVKSGDPIAIVLRIVERES